MVLIEWVANGRGLDRMFRETFQVTLEFVERMHRRAPWD